MTGGDAQSVRDTLSVLLATGCDAAERLSGLLEKERAALETADSDALAAVAADKQACVTELESLEASRRKTVAAAGFDGDPQALQEFHYWCDSTGTLARKWAEYLDAAARCRDANLVNGAAIRMRHQHLGQALAVMAGDRQQTYGPAGHDHGAYSRSLAEA